MNELKYESIWHDQRKFEEAECLLYKNTKCCEKPREKQVDSQSSSIVDQIAKARETIQQTLKGETGQPAGSSDTNVTKRLDTLEKQNQALKEAIASIQANLCKLEERVNDIDVGQDEPSDEPVAPTTTIKTEEKPKVDEDDDNDESDDDFFGSDDEETKARKAEEKQKVIQEAKKTKKNVVGKSNIVLEVKPWDDETDMAIVEQKVRSVKTDGLMWGASKLVPVGYGIKKLQITCVVEDDKVGTDYLEEEIVKFEDHIQSVDIAAFNKV